MGTISNLREQLESSDGTQTMMESCLECVKKSNGVIPFGAGVGGGSLYDLLKENGLTGKLLGWADNNRLKFGKPYKANDLLIFDPKNLIDLFGTEPTVIVASSAYDTIKDQLIGYGYPENKIKLYNFAFMDLKYTDKQFIFDHIDDFERAYSKMGDAKSKRIFVNILNYKITKNEKYLQAMKPDVDDEHYQYFPEDIYDFLEQESFLDVGAYTGDTFTVFNECYQGKWKHYYGLEADGYVYGKLQNEVKPYGDSRVSIYKIAAWDEKTVLSFEENAGSSKMEPAKRGENSIAADRVDNFLGDKKITLIKMDIEGAEFNALSGMQEIIKKNKPVLAICVYHRRDDFYRLTDFIENTVPNEYRYFMRQYRYTPTETVCYMVPEERVKSHESKNITT